MFSIPRVSSIREKPDLDLMGRKMDLDHKPQVEKYLSCLGMSLLPRKEDQGLEREVREKEVERGSKIPGSSFYSHTHTHTHTHTATQGGRLSNIQSGKEIS